jgi:hypothetical protein
MLTGEGGTALFMGRENMMGNNANEGALSSI